MFSLTHRAAKSTTNDRVLWHTILNIKMILFCVSIEVDGANPNCTFETDYCGYNRNPESKNGFAWKLNEKKGEIWPDHGCSGTGE